VIAALKVPHSKSAVGSDLETPSPFANNAVKSHQFLDAILADTGSASVIYRQLPA
jgi:hypothetical protein